MPEINANVSLRDGPNGNKIGGKVAHAGDAVTVLEVKAGWSHVKVANAGQDEGWVLMTFIDEVGTGPAAPTIDKQKFANSCVIQALINGVNPHYLVGVAQVRSGITGGNDGDRIGPLRLTAAEWNAVVPPFIAGDINSNNQQIGGFAFMVQKLMVVLGDSATPLQLYKQQWTDAPDDIEAKLKAAFDDTAAIEAKAEEDILDPPADSDADPPASGDQFGETPSSLPISKRAYNLIISFEVSSQAVYNKRYRHPEWPGGKSGVTVGIGYDVGYCSEAQLNNDWLGEIAPAMIASLQGVRGLKGQAARNAHSSVQNVDVPWQNAINVHSKTVIPRWVTIVTKAVPGASNLNPDCLGALVSLAYNRGASFSAQGARYAEMRGIKQAVASNNLSAIPGLIRDMKRLWPGVRGLLIRRDREAQLFQDGLSGGGTPIQGSV